MGITILREVLKFVKYLLIGVLILFLITYFALLTDPVQKRIAHKLEHYIGDKTKTHVEIGEIGIKFPFLLIANNVFLEDERHDTLISAGEISADISWLKLFSKKIELKSLSVSKGNFNIYRNLPDTQYNFNFLTRVFSSPDKNTSNAAFSGPIIQNIELQNVFLKYNDDVTGIKLRLNAGKAFMSFGKFDIEHDSFFIDEVSLENSSLAYVQAAGIETEENTPTEIKLRNLAFQNVQFDYREKTANSSLSLNIGASKVKVKELDPKKKLLTLESLRADNTKTKYLIYKNKSTESRKNNPTQTWKIKVEKINLSGNTLAYDDQNSLSRTGIDYNHLMLSEFSTNTSEFYLNGDKVNAKVRSLSLKERGGFRINQFSSELSYSPKEIEFKKLMLITPSSQIADYLYLKPSDSVENFQILAHLKNSRFKPADIAFFRPGILKTPEVALNKNTSVYVNGNISGKVKYLDLERLEITSLKNTSINVTGTIAGLPNASTTTYDLVIHRATTSSNDLYKILPDSMIPKNISLPGMIDLKGNFHGSPNSFKTEVTAKTSYGNVSGELSLMSIGAGIKEYSTNLSMADFALGNFLKQSSIGKATLHLRSNGIGSSFNDLSGQVLADASLFEINGYAYKNISADLNIQDALISGTGSVNDKNLQLNITGEARLRKADPVYNFTLIVNKADLNQIGLSKDTILMQGTAVVAVKGKDSTTYIGNAFIKDVLLTKNDKQYKLDSLFYLSINEGEVSRELQASAIALNVTGAISLGHLPGVLQNHVNRYFNIDKLVQNNSSGKLQDFSFNIAVNKPRPFLDLFNIDAKIQPFKASGSYKNRENNLNLTSYFPYIEYAGNKLDSAAINIHSDDKKLYYDLTLRRLTSKNLNINHPLVTGTAHDNLLEPVFSITGNDTDKFVVGGVLKQVGNEYRFSINPNEFLIDSKPWIVSPENYIQFTGKKFYINDLKISKDKHELELSSPVRSYTSPLNIKFKDFDIGLISRVLKADTLMWQGVTNGYVSIENILTSPGFTSDLKVKTLIFKGDTLGNLTLLAGSKINGKHIIKLTLNGNGNELIGSGYYIPAAKTNSLDIALDINKLNLASIKGFSKGYISDMSGSITSKFKITGTPKEPLITGFIYFKDTRINLNYVNTDYRIIDEKLEVIHGNVNFNSFEILDSLGNKAIITGNINAGDINDIKLNLDIITNDFLALNSHRRPKSVFFGTAYMDSRVHLGGTSKNPVIDINAKFNKGSNFTILVPDGNRPVKGHEGVVEFVTAPGIENNINPNPNDSLISAVLKNIDLTANVEVDERAGLKLIVDETGGDSLNVKGKTTFSFSIDPSGKYSLTGVYEIYEGSYYFSLNDYIKKKFQIQKGSLIRWTGDPFGAELDIHAVCTVKASAIDLMEPQLISVSETERNKFRQRLPFEVHLLMKNKLLQPDIAFEILLPQYQQGVFGGTVYARLNQLNQVKSDLNQQVFALLMLNRFITQSPFASPGDELNVAGRTGVSKFFSQQLNYFSANNIKAVDLSFDVNSYLDYSTGQGLGRTDLSVGASKSLMKDRMRVQAENVFDIQGNKTVIPEDTVAGKISSGENTGLPGTGTKSNLAGDVAVEYDLTRDGVYKVRGLRRTGYVGVFDGEISETRLSVIFNKDYNRFRELFRKPKEDELLYKKRR